MGRVRWRLIDCGGAELRLPSWTGNLGESTELAAWARRVDPDIIIGSPSHVYWRLREGGFEMPGHCAFVALQKPDQDGRIAGMRNNFDRQCLVAMDWIELKLRRRHLGSSALPQAVSIQAEWQSVASLPEAGAG